MNVFKNQPLSERKLDRRTALDLLVFGVSHVLLPEANRFTCTECSGRYSR